MRGAAGVRRVQDHPRRRLRDAHKDGLRVPSRRLTRCPPCHRTFLRPLLQPSGRRARKQGLDLLAQERNRRSGVRVYCLGVSADLCQLLAWNQEVGARKGECCCRLVVARWTKVGTVVFSALAVRLMSTLFLRACP